MSLSTKTKDPQDRLVHELNVLVIVLSRHLEENKCNHNIREILTEAFEIR